jgi:hypothetical protein
MMGSHKVTITLGPAGGKSLVTRAIRGRVVDEQGEGIAGARVIAWHEEMSKDKPHPKAEDLSDDEGNFVLEGLDDGLHTLEAAADGRAPTIRKKVASGEAKLVVSLGPGAILEGRVLDPDGKPVPSFHVVVEKKGGVISQPYASRAVIDGDGRFVLTECPSGEVRVLANAAGLAPSAPVTVNVPAPPAKAEPIEIRLPRGAKLSGRVVDRTTTEAIVNARVTVEGGPHMGGVSAAPFAAFATTDEEGGFEIAGLAPGKRAVVVVAFGHDGRVVNLDVVDGSALGPLTIDLLVTKDGEQPKTEYAGIGVILEAKDDLMVIEKVVPGGGAAEAGLVVGDAIVGVEGRMVNDVGMDGSISLIRGPEGTSVSIQIKRATDGKVVTVVVTRRKLSV